RRVLLAHGARKAKGLLHAGPLAGQKLIEFGTGDQLADFQTPMPFVTGPCPAPVPAIERRLAEKELQVVVQGGLIALGDQQIEAASSVDVRTEGVLSVQGIG